MYAWKYLKKKTDSVTSYSSIVLARANWYEGDIHKRITTVKIDFSPSSIHGLACQKLTLWLCLLCCASSSPNVFDQLSDQQSDATSQWLTIPHSITIAVDTCDFIIQPQTYSPPRVRLGPGRHTIRSRGRQNQGWRIRVVSVANIHRPCEPKVVFGDIMANRRKWLFCN